MAGETTNPTPTPDVTATTPTADTTTPDYTQQTTPAQLTPPNQPPQPATAPASTVSNLSGTNSIMGGPQPKVHGFLGRVALGALGALASVGKATSIGQNLQNQNLERQQKQTLIQGEQQRQQFAQKGEERAEAGEQRAEAKEGREVQDWQITHQNAVMAQTHQAFVNAYDESNKRSEVDEKNKKFFDDVSKANIQPSEIDKHFKDLNQANAKSLATSDHAAIATSGKGADAGLHIYTTADLDFPITHELTIPTDWHVDPKTGELKSNNHVTMAADGTHTYLEAYHFFNNELSKGNTEEALWQQKQEAAQKAAKTSEDTTKAQQAPALGQAEIAQKRAEAESQRAAAALNEAQLKNLQNGSGGNTPQEIQDAETNLPMDVKTDLQKYPANIQANLIRAAAGWLDPNEFPTRLYKGQVGITRGDAEGLLVRINPNYTDALYKTIQDTQKKYVTGKEGQGIRSFNQFLVHADEARKVSEQLQRTKSPALNAPINQLRNKYFGQPGVPEMLTAVEAARHEWQSFIDAGYKPDEEQNKRANILMSDTSSPAAIMGVLGIMGDQSIGRLDQINEGYKTATGMDFPNLITPSGREAANNLGLGGKINQYKTGGALNAGRGQNIQPNSIPPGARPVMQNNTVIGYTTDGKTMIPVQGK